MDKTKTITIEPFNKQVQECPVCGSKKNSKFGTIVHFAKVRYRLCNKCGLVFQSPTYTEDYWNNFYKKSYRLVYEMDDKPTHSVIEKQIERAKVYTRFISSEMHTTQISSHLDIGSSAGILLKQIKDIFNPDQSVGIEPGEEYRVFTEQKGYLIYKSIDDLMKAKKNSI